MPDFDDMIGPFLVVAVVGIIAFMAWAAIKDSEEWDAFKTAHNCKIVAEVKGDVFNTFGVDSKGGMTVGIGSTPDKKGWLCNAGKTYFR